MLNKRKENYNNVIKIFDIHTHIFPDNVASGALDYIHGLSGVTPSFDGTRNGLISSIDNAQYTAVLNCPIATTPSQVESINKFALANNNDPIFSLGTIHPDSENKKEILLSLKSKKIKGIKLHPEYQHFTPEDKRMIPIWEFCNENNFIILTHSGKDAGIDENVKGTPEAFAKIAKKYPKLKLILAHFGGWNMWDDVEKYLIGTNVFLDTSFTLGLINDKQFIRIIKNHGIDKILYGTDAPWQDQKQYLKHFLSLELTDQEKKQILWDNSSKLLSLNDEIISSKPV